MRQGENTRGFPHAHRVHPRRFRQGGDLLKFCFLIVADSDFQHVVPLPEAFSACGNSLFTGRSFPAGNENPACSFDSPWSYETVGLHRSHRVRSILVSGSIIIDLSFKYKLRYGKQSGAFLTKQLYPESLQVLAGDESAGELSTFFHFCFVTQKTSRYPSTGGNFRIAHQTIVPNKPVVCADRQAIPSRIPSGSQVWHERFVSPGDPPKEKTRHAQSRPPPEPL